VDEEGNTIQGGVIVDPESPREKMLDAVPEHGSFEVWDDDIKSWRPLSELKGYDPQVPLHQPVPFGLERLYVPPGAPENVVGIHPVDIEAMLDEHAKVARVHYKGKGYAPINTHLRGVEYNADYDIEDLDAVIEDLDRLIASGALPVPRRLTRGINLSRIETEFPNDTLTIDYENLQPGEVFTDEAYQSFSSDYDAAASFAYGGGHVYEIGMVPEHHAVIVNLDAPVGMNMAFFKGSESEHLIGRGQPLRVMKVKKTETWKQPQGVKLITTELWVEPDGFQHLPGVNRLVLEELPPTQQVNARLTRDAIIAPDRLESMLDEHIDEVDALAQVHIGNLIDEGERALPPTVVKVGDSLAADLVGLVDDEITAASGAIADLRLRMQDIAGTDELGTRLTHALAYAMASGAGMRLGWKEIVRRLEGLWSEGPGGANSASLEAIDRALFKGVAVAQRLEPLDTVVSDTLDVLLGNRSRRAVGRGERQEPVLVDALTMMGAGYAEDTVPTAYTHEFVTDFYNRKAAAANAQTWGGRKDWSAAEMSLLTQRRMQKELGKSGIAVDQAEVDAATRTLPTGIYPRAGSEIEFLSPLLDIYYQTGNRPQLVGLIEELGLTVWQQLRDEMGVPVLRIDGEGIGMFDRGVAQPMVPLSIIGSDGKAEDMADLTAYIMGQREVWSFRPSDVDELTDLKPLTPRVQLLIPALATDAKTQDFATQMSEVLGQRGSMRGAHAYKTATGDWVMEITDEGGVFARLDDGSIDEEALNDEIADIMDNLDFPEEVDDIIETGIEYGTVYKGGPKIGADGEPDWDGLAETLSTRLPTRPGRTGAEQLDDLRSTYEWAFKQKLNIDAPKQYKRLQNGEPLRPGVLEDRRGGSVRGFTDIDADGRAVIGAVGQPDPVTGMHELMHVHARTLDPSAKSRIIASYEDAQSVKRADLQTRIDRKLAQATTARSASARTRARNEATALQAELGGMAPQVDWGAEHEEFFVDQFLRYIHQGRTPNPEMTNVMEHFGTWTTKLQSELFPKGSPALSPQMSALFDTINRKSRKTETVNYSVEHETMRMAMKQQLRDAWDEAHGTHYYRKDRRWFERSVNHPYLGVYPSSYMWGKVLPEMVRFLALRPFGYETPFLAWNVLREVSDTVSYQSETNQDFRQWLEDNDRALMLFSMLFPAVPNDVSSNASLPLRRVAEQSLSNQYKNAQGIPFGKGTGEIKDIDYLSGMEDAVNYAIGPLGALRTGGEIVGMGQKLIEGLGGEKRAPGEVPQEALDIGGLPSR
jgi:hypothetical protein